MPALFSGNATFTWRPDSLLGARSWPAGTTETFTYDAAKRPSQLQVRTGANTTLATISTAFDRVGNLTSESQVIGGIAGLAGNSTLTFTNDPLRRVTGYTISGQSPVSYTYDANSNRTSAGATTFTYNRADQLVSQTKASVTRSFTYDAAGNQTSSPVSPLSNSSWTYDAANQPLTVAVPGQPLVSYTYDALGRRAGRSAAGATETYSYVGALIGRIDRGAGGVTDSAIDAMGDRLTVGSAWTIPTVRGDVAGLLNTAGSAITDAYRYDPFGVSLNTQGTSVNPYRFQGRLLESTSGQYDFGARQYDPAIGAFTSLDTVMGQAQNPLSLNRYLYAHANPLVLIDLDGHRATEYDGNSGRYQNAVADARAAVTAARTVLTAAASTYGWATAAANWARGRLSDPCPLTQCPGREDRADWRQSRLDAYTAAVTIRDAARARYDAAASAYASAEAHLRAAVAQASRRSKPAATARAAPSRSSPATRADDGGILGGFVRGLWNATGGFALSLVGDPVGTIVGTVEPFAYVATHLDRAPSDFMAGVDYMRSQSVSDRVEFLTTIATGVVISRKLPSIRARAPAGTIAAEGVAGAVRIHGNSASSQATSYLYRLEVATTGEYLKTGISQNPLSRYSQTFMRGKEMEILQQGSRREMLNLERFIVERDPGPLNREPWAGRLANDTLGGE